MRDTKLVVAIGGGGSAIAALQSAGLLASIGGSLFIEDDRSRHRAAARATPMAWRPAGPHDPALVLLRMDCVDAEVSISDAGMTRFVWELARPRFRERGAPVSTAFHPTLH